jgi:CHAT domain/Right handed beta helix region
MSSPVKILFVSANPVATARLQVDKEQREIDHELRLSRSRDRFDLIIADAARPEDLQQALLDHEPQIVHFSGHGSSEGVILEDDNGEPKLVSATALANLFKLFSGKVQCVLLNACYSEAQAKAIAQHVPYVIGMHSEIPDGTALKFATGFYKGLAAGKTIEFAFDLGVNAVQMDGMEGAAVPQLLKSVYNVAPSSEILVTEKKTTTEVTAPTTAKPFDIMAYRNWLIGAGAVLLAVLAFAQFKTCGKTNTIATQNDSTQTNPATIPTPPTQGKGVVINQNIKENITLKKGIYDIPTPLIVEYNATLTIEPGAILRFGQESALVVESGGTIKAIGTAAEPILFEGQSDSEGFWSHIAVSSNTKQNILKYCKIINGGGNSLAVLHIGSRTGRVGRLTCQNTEIRSSKSSGVFVHAESTIDNFTENTISNCGAYPIVLQESNCDQVPNNNKFLNNKQNFITIQGSYNSNPTNDMTLSPHTIPYLFLGDETTGACYFGGNLKIMPGTKIKMGSSAALHFDDRNGHKGTLTAIGTSSSPILIEGLEGTAGVWDGIYLLSNSSKNDLQYCTIRDGGRTQHCCGGGNDRKSGMITCSEYWMDYPSTVNIQHCTIENSFEAGIFIQKSSTKFNADITNSNTFSGNKGGDVVVD